MQSVSQAPGSSTRDGLQVSELQVQPNVVCSEGQGRCDASPNVVAKGKVVSVPSSLKPKQAHPCFRVLEEGFSRVLKENNGWPMYGSIRSKNAKGAKCNSVASKALPRKDAKAKKKDKLGRKQTVVVDWALKLASLASSSGAQDTYPLGVPDNKVQWIEISTFEGGLHHKL
ncbi:hypothetical protein V6N13_148750 [Hibiscus sabdariffa]